jgi:hypothetical protein
MTVEPAACILFVCLAFLVGMLLGAAIVWIGGGDG